MRRLCQLRVAILLLGAVAANADAQERPIPGVDPEGSQRLEQLEFQLDRGVCDLSCIRQIEGLHQHDELRIKAGRLLERGYLRIKDWQALAGLLESLDPDSISQQQQALLALAHHQTGRYSDAAEVLRGLLGGRPGDPILSYRLGAALMALGEDAQALGLLQASIPSLTGEQAAEAATSAALIQLRNGDAEAADELLGSVLASQPDYLPAVNALVRVYAALGRSEEQMEELLARAAELRNEIVAGERHAMVMSALSRQASEACVERRWDECELLVRKMLLQAESDQERIQLRRYLAGVYEVADRPEDARTERERALALESEAQ